MSNAEDQGWNDVELGRVITSGILLGVPLLLAVATLMCVVGGVPVWTAVAIAGTPAVFVGPYLGGLAFMGRASARHDVPAPVAVLEPSGRERRAA